jgi:hypothetical protein
MKKDNPWKGPVEGLPEGGVFTHAGEVAVQVIAIGKDWQDLQYTPVVNVSAGDDIDKLRTAVIEWIEAHSADSLPGVQSVEYTVLIVSGEGEQLAEEQAFESGFDISPQNESTDSSFS